MSRSSSKRDRSIPSVAADGIGKPSWVAEYKTMADGTDISSLKLLDHASIAKDVRQLSRVSNWRGALAIAVQWAVIAVAIAAAVWTHHWAVYAAAMLVIATRQHAIGVLAHEAAHYRVFSNRTANDLVGDLLRAFPLGLSTRLYREHHLRHHSFVNTDRDPDKALFHGDEDWSWPKLPWECVKLFGRDLLGLNLRMVVAFLRAWSPAHRFFRRAGDEGTLLVRERVALMLFLVAVTTLLVATDAWLQILLLWVVPELTIFTAIFRIRQLGEHYGLENEHELNMSRHVQPHWWERLLIAPCNVNYHLEHHLYPSVPFYNLPRLHDRLMEEPVFRDNAHRTESYTGIAKGVLGEVLMRSPYRRAQAGAVAAGK